MKPISPETYSDLTELLRPESLWERLQGREAHLLTVMERIRERAEPPAVRYLAAIIFDPRPSVQHAALETIDHLLRRRTPQEIVRLVDEFRRFDTNILGTVWNAWAGIQPQDLERWRHLGPAANALFAILSGHGSGFVREAAVRLLSESSAPYLIPVLRVRLNDWVGEVRKAALQVITPLLEATELADLLVFLPILEDLRRCERGSHSPLLDRLHIRFRVPEARQLLIAGCAHPDPTVRWQCFKIRCDYEQAEPFRLEMLRYGDLAMRRSVAAAILAEAKQTDPAPYLDLLLTDRFMSVRRDGLLALVTWQGPNAFERLKTMMTDRNATVREFARYYVGKWSSATLIIEHYRTTLAFGAGLRLAGSLAGMGDVGDATDARRIVPFCTHQRPSIRRVAFLALDRLVSVEDISPFLPALKDPSSRVRQVAAAALGRRWQSLSAEDLLQRFFHSEPPERHGVVAILAYLGFLDRLGAYLVILASHSSPFQETAAQNIRQLLRSTTNGYIDIDPDSLALRRISSALPTVSEALATQVKDYMRLLTGMASWPEPKAD